MANGWGNPRIKRLPRVLIDLEVLLRSGIREQSFSGFRVSGGESERKEAGLLG